MTLRLKTTDCEIIECIAEHRILTVSQVAAVFHKSRQVVRRRLRDLEKVGFVEVVGSELGRGRGRPESSLGLTEQGIDVLKERGMLGQDVPYDKVLGDSLFAASHQLLLNWFRIHLKEVERILPRLNIKVMAQESPFLPKAQDGRIFIIDHSPVPNSGMKGVTFTPDAVFAVADSVGGKTCLFFLEVDRGTEIVASPKRDMKDIRQKIINYQWYFQSGGYKRYEAIFGASLRGFRLLFLTSTNGGLVALCKLIREMEPSN
ncbi:MAG: replication-relaxation family protein, partial [Sedimentisphaerales bacterium]|nr:replication-relaxation family protein [Sedimentisphaerales bacterium]